MKIISINQKSRSPKYKQIIISIEKAIASGTLKKGDKLPSINYIRDNFSLSRDTVMMAFNELKTRGIIQSTVGKGYYVSSENVTVTKKIFLLFDELNSFKEDLYNSFTKGLGDNIKVDLYFHHFNASLFDKLIRDAHGDYNFYVIMPANIKNAIESIKVLPTDQVYLLDQTHEELADYPSVFQNFEKNVFEGLQQAQAFITNYKKIILLFSPIKQPIGILNGLTSFCDSNQMDYEIIETLDASKLQEDVLYFVLDDRDLVFILKKLKDQNLKLGDSLGILSYNDTLLKEIVEGGITTISTDFAYMGQRLATMILNKEHLQVENPNSLIVRNSL